VHARGLCRRHYEYRQRHGTLPPKKIPPTIEERFWSHVDRRGPDECWPWRRGRSTRGYGTLFVRAGELGQTSNTILQAHRVAFYLIHGRWPDPHALHGCDNPPCCNALNPEHIHEGDHFMNMQEKVARGRHQYPRGPNHAQAKLTAHQVREIRTRYAAGGIRQADLASEFGTVQSTIGKIVRRETYREVA
jgi:hypothetical protein